jgi:hypothetical protein
MDAMAHELIKQREIRFVSLDPQANPAREAMGLLLDTQGIEDSHALTPDCLQVRYNLTAISLQIIEEALETVGFHLDNGLLAKMKRALFHYTEETQLSNLGYPHDQANSTLDVFINCYNQRQHGCRDSRPPHLRQYS